MGTLKEATEPQDKPTPPVFFHVTLTGVGLQLIADKREHLCGCPCWGVVQSFTGLCIK